MVRNRRQTVPEASPQTTPDGTPTPAVSEPAAGPTGQDQQLPAESLPRGTANFQFKRTDRFLALGESLSGKSFLARAIITQTPRRVIITPHSEEWTEEPNRIVARNEEQLLDGIHQALKAGNCIVVLDDLDILIKKTEKDPRANMLFMGARHRGVGYFCISRRTADLPTIIFQQSNKVFLFQTDLPADLELYRDFYNCADAVKALNSVSHQCLFIDRDRKTR